MILPDLRVHGTGVDGAGRTSFRLPAIGNMWPLGDSGAAWLQHESCGLGGDAVAVVD